MNANIILPVLALLVVVGLVGLGGAQSPCDLSVVTAVRNFSMEAFAEGSWYAHSLFKRVRVVPPRIRCYIHTFEKESNGSSYLYYENAIEIASGNATSVTSRIEPQEPQSVWKLTYLPDYPVSAALVHTDYSSYGIEYQCLEDDGEEYLYILTKSPSPDAQVISILESIAIGYGFPRENGIQYDNSDCSSEL